MPVCSNNSPIFFSYRKSSTSRLFHITSIPVSVLLVLTFITEYVLPSQPLCGQVHYLLSRMSESCPIWEGLISSGLANPYSSECWSSGCPAMSRSVLTSAAQAVWLSLLLQVFSSGSPCRSADHRCRLGKKQKKDFLHLCNITVQVGVRPPSLKEVDMMVRLLWLDSLLKGLS